MKPGDVIIINEPKIRPFAARVLEIEPDLVVTTLGRCILTYTKGQDFTVEQAYDVSYELKDGERYTVKTCITEDKAMRLGQELIREGRNNVKVSYS